MSGYPKEGWGKKEDGEGRRQEKIGLQNQVDLGSDPGCASSCLCRSQSLLGWNNNQLNPWNSPLKEVLSLVTSYI